LCREPASLVYYTGQRNSDWCAETLREHLMTTLECDGRAWLLKTCERLHLPSVKIYNARREEEPHCGVRRGVLFGSMSVGGEWLLRTTLRDTRWDSSRRVAWRPLERDAPADRQASRAPP